MIRWDTCADIIMEKFELANTDQHFMREALALAEQGWGLTSPNPMVGAVIVRNGKIIGRGFHHRAGQPHAEINALADAQVHGNEVRGATLYVTLEPCSTVGRTPACTDAIQKAGIARVVVGGLDPNPKHAGRGIKLLEQANIHVDLGVEETDCRELNRPFFKWVTTGHPWVILKLATTLDGRIATESGDSKWVTGSEARSRVQRLRQLSGAILVGSETVRRDRPQLTVREPKDWPCQPLRLVASHSLNSTELREYFPDGNARVVRLDNATDWGNMLDELGQRDITCLLIEGGGELAASALNTGVVDYVEFHLAPKLLGGRGSRAAIGGDNPDSMSWARRLHRTKVIHYGEDIAISGYLEDC